MIRPAGRGDAPVLTRISFASKAHWRYPEAYFDIWRDELTITREYIDRSDVFVYESGGEVVGYYSVVSLPEDIVISGSRLTRGFWLEHMFIDPPHIGKGIGSRLFRHLQCWCEENGIGELGILADPNARGFYEKMGCRYIGEFPSTIPDRTTPHLLFRP